MFETIKKLFLLVEKRFYKKFLFIQLLIIISGTIEIVSFFSILPFISLIANPDILDSGIGLSLYQFSGLKTTENFMLVLGLQFARQLEYLHKQGVEKTWKGFGRETSQYLHCILHDVVESLRHFGRIYFTVGTE